MKRLWDERARRDAFRFIEWNPKHWHGDVDAFFRVGEERTSLLVDPVLRDYGPTPGAEFAVEVGCGVGRFARALAARFGHVIGVDVSQEMIRKARELNPPTHFPNLAFAAGDGVTLPVSSATAAFVFSYEVFQHMPSRRVIDANLREVARILAPDGTALLHFPYAKARWSSWAPARAAYDLLRAAKHSVRRADVLVADPTYRGIPWLPLPGIVSACEAAGLRAVETRHDPTNSSHVFVITKRSAASAE
ncbi:MAG TPA: methyltransferase domain-containing protein [Gaiellaceae bacterium]|jgi:SAM-dependent methyltransferase|nr:methyltransferase domain-containing protein [Gaiellaceae bacterium]